MTSVAARKRSRKLSAKLGTRTTRKAKPATLIAHANNNAVRYQEKTGVDWLLHKGKITSRQHRAGQRYGHDFRVVDVNGMVPLASCLDDTPRASTARSGLCVAVFDLQAQDRLMAARQALADHEEMVRACDAICGRDRTPWEIAQGVQKEADKWLQTLRIALDLLSRHYSLG